MAYDVDAYVDFNNNHNQYMRGYMDGIQQGKVDTLEEIHKLMTKTCGGKDCDECVCKSVDADWCEDKYVLMAIDSYIEKQLKEK